MADLGQLERMRAATKKHMQAVSSKPLTPVQQSMADYIANVVGQDGIKTIKFVSESGEEALSLSLKEKSNAT